MLQRLAHFSYHRRRLVVVAWIVALIGVIALGNSVGAKFSQNFQLPGTESQRAQDLLTERFPVRAGAEGRIVFGAPAGVNDPDVAAGMTSVFEAVALVEGVTAVDSPYAVDGASRTSRNGNIAYATIQFEKQDDKVRQSTVNGIEDAVNENTPPGVRTALGGEMFADEPSLGSAELIGILAAMVILLVVFGSVLAMGLPIMVALFGIGIGIALVELMSHFVSTPDVTTQLASMIGIGVGIDYALFIVTRYRQGLQEGREPEDAVVRAIDTAGRAVLFAGITVVISILGLFLMGVDFVRGLAVGTSITVALVMFASITLLPAVLGFAGRNIDKFSVRRQVKEIHSRKGFWFRWSRLVQRRPWPALLGALALLLILTIPFLSMRVGFGDEEARPRATRLARPTT